MSDSKEDALNSNENEQKTSIANIVETKAKLSEEIKSIEKVISEIDDAKKKSIDIIESKKKLLQEQNEVEDVCAEHKKALEELAVTEKEIEARKYSITLLDETIAQLDIQIAEIQAQHDQAIAELEAKKQSLTFQLEYCSELDAKVAKLAELLLSENTSYEQKLSCLLEERENLLKRTDLSETTLQARLKELDDLLRKCNKEHEESVKSLNKLISEVTAAQTSAERLITGEPAVPEQIIQVTELEGEGAERAYSITGEHSARGSGKIYDEYHYKDYYYPLRPGSTTPATREFSDLEAEETYEGRHAKLAQEYAFRRFLQYREQFPPLSASSSSTKSSLTSQDVEYLKNVFGKCLSLALAEITAVQPTDPIHYLAHWLMKYRYNEEYNCVREAEIMALMVEREKLEAIKKHEESQKEAQDTMRFILDRVDILTLEQELARLAMLTEEMAEG